MNITSVVWATFDAHEILHHFQCAAPLPPQPRDYRFQYILESQSNARRPGETIQCSSPRLVRLAPLIELSDDLFLRNRPTRVEILDTLCDLPALPLVRIHIDRDRLCREKRFRPPRLRRKVLKALLHAGV